MYFKVITKKICIVEADDIEEAREMAYDNDVIILKEEATEIAPLTSSQKRRLEMQLMED